MTTEPSPLPWRMEKAADEGRFWIVRNPDGVSIGMTWLEADAAFIVDAVNERDRLRDIVKRMMEKLAVLNAGYRLLLSEGPEDAEMADLCSRIDALVREARAALGAGETPTGKGVG